MERPRLLAERAGLEADTVMSRVHRFLCRMLKCTPIEATPHATDEPEGIQGFNECTVYILGRLYGAFPEPIDFNMHLEVVRSAVDHHSQRAALESVPLRTKYISSTMRWLANHGYIEVGDAYLDGNYGGVELSEKAFKALGLVPLSIRPALVEKPKSLGELMREAAVSQGASMSGDLVKVLIATTTGAPN